MLCHISELFISRLLVSKAESGTWNVDPWNPSEASNNYKYYYILNKRIGNQCKNKIFDPNKKKV